MPYHLLTSKKSKKEDVIKNLGECEPEKNISLSCNYILEILNSDNSVKSRPFGDTPIKATILDNFLKYIIGGYLYNDHGYNSSMMDRTVSLFAALMNCSVSNDQSKETRKDKRSEGSFGGGNALKTTYASTYFNISRSGDTTTMSRDFSFSQEVSNVTYADAWVACGYFNGPNNTAVNGVFMSGSKAGFGTSRFVFPSQISLLATEKLRIIFTLIVKTPQYIDGGMPIKICNSNLDFSGVIGYGGSNIGNGIEPIVTVSSTLRTYDPNGVYSNNDFNFATPSMVGFPSTMEARTSAIQPNIMRSTASSATGITTQAIGNFTFYPTNPGSAPAITGPEMYNTTVYSLVNFLYTDDGASSDLFYYFPPHTASRSATGIILNYRYGTSRNNTFLRFNSTQVIPAYVPIALKMRWRINRD
jgi:hypothetical protein